MLSEKNLKDQAPYTPDGEVDMARPCRACGHRYGIHRDKDDRCPTVREGGEYPSGWSKDSYFRAKQDERFRFTSDTQPT